MIIYYLRMLVEDRPEISFFFDTREDCYYSALKYMREWESYTNYDEAFIILAIDTELNESWQSMFKSRTVQDILDEKSKVKKRRTKKEQDLIDMQKLKDMKC